MSDGEILTLAARGLLAQSCYVTFGVGVGIVSYQAGDGLPWEIPNSGSPYFSRIISV